MVICLLELSIDRTQLCLEFLAAITPQKYKNPPLPQGNEKYMLNLRYRHPKGYIPKTNNHSHHEVPIHFLKKMLVENKVHPPTQTNVSSTQDPNTTPHPSKTPSHL